MYLDRARNFLQELNPKLEKQFVGCSDAEIAELEGILDVPIPAAFREFLTWFGKSGGNLMRGSCYYFDHIAGKAHPTAAQRWQGYTLKHEAIELLDEHGLQGAALLEHALVFMEHQGYMFEFIPTNKGDNPPVYYFKESSDPKENIIRPWADSFSDYIENLFQNQAQPSNSLKIYEAIDWENRYSYDAHITELSFNGSYKSRDGGLPDRIFDFPNLESLDLRYFELTRLSPRIATFKKLKTLNLNSNLLPTLPRELFYLHQLETLYLAGNQLSGIRPPMTQLDSLKLMDLRRNPIPPEQIEFLRRIMPWAEIRF